MKTERTKPNVCIVTFPLPSNTIYLLLFDLAKILQPISHRVYLLTGGIPKEFPANERIQTVDIGYKMQYRKSIRPKWASAFLWIARFILIQIKMPLAMLKLSGQIDMVIFFIGVPFLLLPMLIAKTYGKIVVWY